MSAAGNRSAGCRAAALVHTRAEGTRGAAAEASRSAVESGDRGR